MSVWRRSACSAALAWIIVAVLGAIEGLYGRTQYLADWISYLTVSHAVSALDWKGIFDPMWNPGYPALVALARAVFPPSVQGEWYAIFVLNWLIFLAAYASFRYLIRQAIEFYDPSLVGLTRSPVLIWAGVCVFLAFGLAFDHVSRVSPDLMVTMLFLLAGAQMLRLASRPTVGQALLLGVVLAAGCWVKGVFLTFAVFFFLALALVCARRKLPLRIPLLAGSSFLLLWVPYVALISWAYGRPTLGVSGSLNYAFHVNELPHWSNWQGGPAPFGKPLHASRQILHDLPVFEFKTPFQSTYPPFNNLAYWYQGYHSFFSLKNQLMAMFRSLYFLAEILVIHPIFYALAGMMAVILLKREWRSVFTRVSAAYWPVLVPALLGLATYLAVHIEDRYLSCFFFFFALVPLTPLLDKGLQGKRSFAIFVMTALVAGSVAELAVTERHAFKSALLRRDYHSDEQWKLAETLPAYGLKRGDTVAVIGGLEPNMRASWAYVSGLRIVGEFGSLPWRIQPASRMWFERADVEKGDKDYAQVFWALTPEQRARVIQAFESIGVRAIVCLESPAATPEQGWTRVGETKAWIYAFGPGRAETRQTAALSETTSR